jgi:hypothetical protein
MKLVRCGITLVALSLVSGCWPTQPLPVMNAALPTSCTGVALITDNLLASQSDITNTSNATVTFSNNQAYVHLADPFSDGSVTTGSAIYPVSGVTSVAAIQNIGAPSPIARPAPLPPYPTTPVTGMHVMVPFNVVCAANAPTGAVVQITNNMVDGCGVQTDTFSPTSVTCSPGAVFKVAAQRNWDGNSCHDVGTNQAMLDPIVVTLSSSRGLCVAGLPVR